MRHPPPLAAVAGHARQYYAPLEQAAFQRLKHAPYLKGLFKPFKGKGELEAWAGCCETLREDLTALAQQALKDARSYPFNLLPVHLSEQRTGAGTTFLRWRNPDRSAMGVALWEELVESPTTPIALLPALYALEIERIGLNMRMSLVHTLARQARECARKASRAQALYTQRLARDHFILR